MVAKSLRVAEGMGFEPTIRHYPYNGLANPRFSKENGQIPSVCAGEIGTFAEHCGGSGRHVSRHSGTTPSAGGGTRAFPAESCAFRGRCPTAERVGQ